MIAIVWMYALSVNNDALQDSLIVISFFLSIFQLTKTSYCIYNEKDFERWEKTMDSSPAEIVEGALKHSLDCAGTLFEVHG
jgi:hypothetical protein